ncbi:hypothetical protein C1646_120352 [Rhizophagus diaphanus]|nr:hypothetical protein C1646_120352 [Rhizophagus diaphanus] [Rhizophagus sp. MUCL 43196]
METVVRQKKEILILYDSISLIGTSFSLNNKRKINNRRSIVCNRPLLSEREKFQSHSLFPFNKAKKKIPEINVIDKDFRDGKKVIELLELFYENDTEELPKPERDNSRVHYIQNVNNIIVLQSISFLLTFNDKDGYSHNKFFHYVI